MQEDPKHLKHTRFGWFKNRLVPGSVPFSVMVLVTLVGLGACSWVLSAFLSVLSLSSSSQQHIDQWKEMSRLISYIITRTEDDTINEISARAIQNKIANILVDEGELKTKFDLEVAGSRFSRRLLITTKEEEDVLLTADISDPIRKSLLKIKDIPASFLQAEFSNWNTGTSVEIRSGRVVLPLTKRQEVLLHIEHRGVRILWLLLSFIATIILTVLLLLWYKSMKPTIAALQRTERELLEQSKELQLILDNIPGFVYSFSTDLDCLSANKACINTLGLSSESEVIGQSLRRVVGARNWRRIKDYALRAASGKVVSYDMTTEVLGSQRTLHAKYVPEFSQKGGVQRVFALVVDIHERVLAEQALRDSEENLRITLDSMSDAVIATDVNGNIIRLNPIACALTGWTMKEAMGQNFDTVCHIVKAGNRKILHDPVEQVLALGNIVSASDDKILISKTGTEHSIAESGGPIRNSENQTIGVVLVLRDVTQENFLNKKLMQQDKMQAIGQLAGGIAHDFNNILSGILGSIELLAILERDQLQPKSTELVQSIIRTSARAKDLTSKLTAFARVSDVQFTTVDMSQILDDTLKLIGKTSDRRITITTETLAKDLSVRGSFSNLQLVLLNICLNAVQSMPEGGTLHVKTENLNLDQSFCDSNSFDLLPGAYLKMSITDTGCGISSEDLSKIFEPFFTTKDVDSGTGLGLAAVYGTIQDHHGAISVTSHERQGSVFELLIPTTRDSPIHKAPIPQTQTNGNFKGKILIVDDEESVRNVGKMAIEHLGYPVLVAEHGQAAVDIYKVHGKEIGLVILDMNMSVLNGKETFLELRKLNPDCKIVIATGFTENEDIGYVAQNGAMEILQKPFHISDYARVINNCAGEPH